MDSDVAMQVASAVADEADVVSVYVMPMSPPSPALSGFLSD